MALAWRWNLLGGLLVGLSECSCDPSLTLRVRILVHNARNGRAALLRVGILVHDELHWDRSCSGFWLAGSRRSKNVDVIAEHVFVAPTVFVKSDNLEAGVGLTADQVT